MRPGHAATNVAASALVLDAGMLPLERSGPLQVVLAVQRRSTGCTHRRANVVDALHGLPAPELRERLFVDLRIAVLVEPHDAPRPRRSSCRLRLGLAERSLAPADVMDGLGHRPG